jgi:hypothetical protein
MKITLQDAMEGVRELRRVGNREDGMAASLCALLDQAVLFSFPDVEIPMEHGQFACDLGARGLFTLPFPVTALAIERDSEHGRVGAMTLLEQRHRGGPVSLIEFYEACLDDKPLVLPGFGVMDATVRSEARDETDGVRFSYGEPMIFVGQPRSERDIMGCLLVAFAKW